MPHIPSKKYRDEGPHHSIILMNTVGAWVAWVAVTVLMLIGWDVLPVAMYAVITTALIGLTLWFIRKEKSSRQ